MKLITKVPSLRRSKFAMAALLLAVTAVTPFMTLRASAEQITARSIQMSSSAAGASGVSYAVSFKPGSSYNIQGIVIDFCKDSPIIGYSTCTSPGGSFSVGGTPSVSAVSGAGTGSWTADDLNSGRTLTLSNSSTNNVTTASTISFTVSNVTNPTPADDNDQTFFARIYTFSSNTAPGSYTVGTPGAYEDAGGIALSTAHQVSVSGTVQETLTFCVSGTTTTTTGCTDTDAPALTLGHGTPEILDTTAVDTADAYSQLTTNAGGGAVIRMKNSNACGGLSRNGGTSCDIAPVNGDSDTAAAIAIGDAKFGMQAESDDVSLTVDSTYGHATNYGMEWDDDDVTGVTSPYGSTVASSTGVLDAVNVTYTFGAGAANTTPAGVYTATMVMIATGTY